MHIMTYRCFADISMTYFPGQKEESMEIVSFFLGMYERLLLSVLIDSDWSDAAGFSEEQSLPERLSEKDTLAIWNRAISYFETYMKNIASSDPTGRLNRYRSEISESCYQASRSEKRLYRLTVPTGAGKTFSSLRFALYHAKKI